MSKENLGKSFNKLIHDRFVNIDGVLVEKKGTGFIWHEEYYQSKRDVKNAINYAGRNISNSLNRIKK